MRPRGRFVAIVFLSIVLVVLCVQYGANYEENWPYPTADQLADTPGAFDGEHVLIIGEVQAIDPESEQLTVHVTRSTGELAAEIEVVGMQAPVESGGVVQVYGVLDDQSSVQYAENIVVVNQNRIDLYYKTGTAGLAILLVAGVFLWYWRINWKQLTFEVRHG